MASEKEKAAKDLEQAAQRIRESGGKPSNTDLQAAKDARKRLDKFK